MKKKLMLFLSVMTAFLLLTACQTNDDAVDPTEKQDDYTDEQPEMPGGADNEENQNADTVPELPDTKTVQLMIEGTTEEKTAYLHQHQQLGFSTYVPEDMTVESDEEIFNVYTNFDGTKNENARMFIMQLERDNVVNHFEAEGFTVQEADVKGYEFAIDEYQLEKEGLVGRAATFTHLDEEYILAYYHPQEFADGFSARSYIIVNELVWHDE